MSAEEFEEENIDKYDSYYQMMEAYAEYRKEQSKKIYTEEDIIKFTIWFTMNCIYYDGWNIRVPLGDKYPEVYTVKKIFKIYKKEIL